MNRSILFRIPFQFLPFKNDFKFWATLILYHVMIKEEANSTMFESDKRLDKRLVTFNISRLLCFSQSDEILVMILLFIFFFIRFAFFFLYLVATFYPKFL